MNELWYRHAGPNAAECIGCGQLEACAWDINDENPLCGDCLKEWKP